MKRSSQVALLLMGMGGVGAGAYAVTPPRHCEAQGATPPATIAPAVPGQPATEPCPPRRSWSSTGSSGYRSWSTSRSDSLHWSTPILGRQTAAATVPRSSRAITTTTTSRTTTTTRGGFGSTGRSISSSS